MNWLWCVLDNEACHVQFEQACMLDGVACRDHGAGTSHCETALPSSGHTKACLRSRASVVHYLLSQPAAFCPCVLAVPLQALQCVNQLSCTGTLSSIGVKLMTTYAGQTLSMRSARVAPAASCRPLLQRSSVYKRPNVLVKSQIDDEIKEVPEDVWDSPAIGVAVQV